MEYVVPLIKADRPAPHFRYAFEACALASLGNRVGPGNDFDKQALGQYTKALATTFAALKDPEAAKQDATLAAVLLLGLFENITARQLGLLAWGSHIEGAIQLVKARGRKQLRTKIGLMLFVAVRTQMVGHLSTSNLFSCRCCIMINTADLTRSYIPSVQAQLPSWALSGGSATQSRTNMQLSVSESTSGLARSDPKSTG